MYLDVGWAIRVISLAAAASGKGYVLSYGQVWPPLYVIGGWVPIEYPLVQLLSIYTAIPPLASTIRLFYAHRRELRPMLLRLPGLCLLELKYVSRMVSVPPLRQNPLPLRTISGPPTKRVIFWNSVWLVLTIGFMAIAIAESPRSNPA